MRHPHADVIIAYANGEVVQKEVSAGNWVDHQVRGPWPNPEPFYPQHHWRIKPKVPSKGELLRRAARSKWLDYDSVADEFINLLKENGYALY